jgi:hypothetical protein
MELDSVNSCICMGKLQIQVVFYDMIGLGLLPNLGCSYIA